MPRPRRRAPLPLLCLLSPLLLAVPQAVARTTTFDDTDTLMLYSPAGAWGEVALDGFSGGGAREANAGGATVELAFEGEQLSLYGSSTASFAVEIDGKAVQNAANPSRATFKSSTRIFFARNLDGGLTHSFVLRTSGDGSFRLDKVAVAYSNAGGQVPRLVAVSSNASTSSVATTTRAASTTSSASTPSTLPAMLTDASPRPGVVAGAVIGSFLGVALLVFLAIFFVGRRKARLSDVQDRASYFNAETGRRKSRTSSFFAGLAGGTPRNSSLPFVSSSAAPSQRNGSPFNAADGGIGRSPHPYASHRPPSSAHLAVRPHMSNCASPSSTGAPASQTWAQRLARASSWGRKASRLPETQRFYNVSAGAARTGGAGLPPDPPPARPLPSVPPREMRERWREGAALVQGSGRWESPRASEDAREPGLGGGAAAGDGLGIVEASPATHPIAATHLRKRSVPRADLPSAPPPVATMAPHSPRSFRNPFNSTSTTGMSMPGAHASKDSTGSQWTSSTRASSAALATSLEGARIAHARPVAAPGDDDVPLYGGADGSRAVPLRVSSMREVHQTRRAGPRGEMSSSGRRGDGLARRPTLTLREGGVDDPERAAAGYETQREAEQDGQHERTHRAQQRSAAALIEVVEELGLDDLGGPGGTRDPPPGEEDRSAFFQKRERLPRYSVDRGDPRAPTKGSR